MKISKETQEQIITDYMNNVSNKELSIKFGVHRVTIQSILKRNGVELRKQNLTSRKKFPLHDFDSINSPNKAYYLGLIFADGNLSRNTIDITLKNDDKQILEDISNWLYGGVFITTRESREYGDYKCSKQCRFLMTSKKIANQFRQHGLVEAKTFKITLPELPVNLYSHFIRGYFDGDGCLYIGNNNRVTLTSNYMFCEQLSHYISNALLINANVNDKTENVGIVSISGNKQIKKFLDWIYCDADLKLNRKYKLYLNEYY